MTTFLHVIIVHHMSWPTNGCNGCCRRSTKCIRIFAWSFVSSFDVEAIVSIPCRSGSTDTGFNPSTVGGWRLPWLPSPVKFLEQWKGRLEEWKRALSQYTSKISSNVPSKGLPDSHSVPIPGHRENPETEIPTYTLTPVRASPSSSLSSVRFPVFSIPAFKNHAFVGREQDLADLKFVLDGPGGPPFPNPACCILHGLGGIGKTALARQYAFENQGSYDAVFEIQGDSEWGLRSSFCAIYRSLRLNGSDSDEERMISEAKDWLEGTSKSIFQHLRAPLFNFDLV
jgi:hypothetical protein